MSIAPDHMLDCKADLSRIVQPAHHAALRIAVDLGIFQKMAKGGEKVMSAKQLAVLTDADVVLLGMYVPITSA